LQPNLRAFRFSSGEKNGRYGDIEYAIDLLFLNLGCRVSSQTQLSALLQSSVFLLSAHAVW
jgi:hypothetical protein